MENKSFKPYGIVLLVTAGLYTISLPLNALAVTPDVSGLWPGWALLLMGWLGFFILQFGWLANFPYFLGLLLMLLRKPLAAAICFMLALFVAMNTFLLFFQEIPYNENTMEGAPLHAVLAGFWFWLAAMAAGLIGSLVVKFQQK